MPPARLLAADTAPMNGHQITNQDRIAEACRNGIDDFSENAQFQAAYKYFKGRHLNNVSTSQHLSILTDHMGNLGAKIEQLYKADGEDSVAKMEALLLVAYCLRTNLIHGFKWHSGFTGQEQNFFHAASILMLAVDHLKGDQTSRK